MWSRGKSKFEMQAQGREKSTDFKAYTSPTLRSGSGEALRGIFVLVHYSQGYIKKERALMVMWSRVEIQFFMWGREEKVHNFLSLILDKTRSCIEKG